MASLIYSPGTEQEKIYDLSPGINTIGRGLDNTIILSDSYASVSRHHAQIILENDLVTLQDLHSSNGTFVNENKIEKCLLQENDDVRFGKLRLRFRNEPKPVSPENRADFSLESKEDDELKDLVIKKLPPEHSSFTLSQQWQQEIQSHSFLSAAKKDLAKKDLHQRTIDKLKLLLYISQQISSPEEPDKLLEKVLDLLWELMDMDRAGILMINEESGKLEEKVIKVEPEFKNQKFYSTKITNLVRHSGEAVLISNPQEDKRLNQSLSVLYLSIQESMCVPLKLKNKVIGVIYIDSSSVNTHYSEEDLEFLTALANQVAVTIYMASEFIKREQKLKQEVMELQIQIDQQKKAEEVAQIVESEDFRRLQEKAKRLRSKKN
jgi:pSer/pThr/pTyr-binding forkhead associated (FHA) protein